MKIAEIILQLAVYLPQNDAKFTDNYSVKSITRSSNEFIVQLDEEHNLKPGHGITLLNSESVISISSSSRVSSVATFVTANDHDLTKGVHNTVTISGTSSTNFSGTFTILDILDRNTVTVVMPLPGAETSFGGVLHNVGGTAYSYNGTYGVERIVSPSSFSVLDNRPTIAAPLTDTTTAIRARPRIAGGVDLEKFISMYTKQDDGKWWMFVLLEDVFASKDRDLQTDAIADQNSGSFFHQVVIQPFSLYVIKDVRDDVAGRSARDDIEDMFRGICKSTLWTKYDSHLGVGQQGKVHFMSHGKSMYDSALYVHAFSFQQSCDLSEMDIVAASPDIAFKYFSLEAAIKDGTEVETIQTANVLVTVQ